jgi:hypothetical protein
VGSIFPIYIPLPSSSSQKSNRKWNCKCFQFFLFTFHNLHPRYRNQTGNGIASGFNFSYVHSTTFILVTEIKPVMVLLVVSILPMYIPLPSSSSQKSNRKWNRKWFQFFLCTSTFHNLHPHHRNQTGNGVLSGFNFSYVPVHSTTFILVTEIKPEMEM